MKNKGFTLIELLAVIVILAIISLIAIPTLTHVVNKAKLNAVELGANGYIDSLDKQLISDQLRSNNEPLNDGIYNISDLKTNLKGTGPSNGLVTIEKSVVKEARLCVNDKSIYYDGKNTKLASNNYCGKTKVTILSNGKEISTSSKTNNTYTVDLKNKTNINCNNGAIPAINGNTLTVKNAIGSTTCDIGSSLKYTFTHLYDDENNVIMVSDEVVTSTIINNKKVNINLGNHVITGNGTGFLFENEGILNIKSGKGIINGTMDSINSNSGSKLTIDGGEFNKIQLKGTANLNNFKGHCTEDTTNCYSLALYDKANVVINNYYANTKGKTIAIIGNNFVGSLNVKNSILNCTNDNCVYINAINGSKVEFDNVTINSFGYGIRISNGTDIVINNSNINSGIGNQNQSIKCIQRDEKDGGKIVLKNSNLKTDTGYGISIGVKTNVDISKTNIDTKMYSIGFNSTSTGTVANVTDSILNAKDDHNIYLNPTGNMMLNLTSSKMTTSAKSNIANETGATINIVSGEFNVLKTGTQGAISNRSNGVINICSAKINGLASLYDLYNAKDGRINYTSNVILKNKKIYDPNKKVSLNNSIKCK